MYTASTLLATTAMRWNEIITEEMVMDGDVYTDAQTEVLEE